MAAKKKAKKAKKPTTKPDDAPREIEGPKKPDIQVFKFIRNNDESGISGTGVVAKGVVFEDGSVYIHWLGATPCVTRWDSFEAFKKIHIDSHPDNDTQVDWYGLRKRAN